MSHYSKNLRLLYSCNRMLMDFTLVFVYNAERGLFNAMADLAHKIFSPQTYACQLCALTHTPFGVRAEWRQFLAGLNLPLEFLHRDELQGQICADDVALPVIFKRRGEQLEPWLGAAEINACATLDDLQRLIIDKLTNT